MKAVVYEGPMAIQVREVEDPKIKEPTDVIVRMTSSAICGSDLHMFEGHTDAKPPMILGHEPMGVVEQVGKGVKYVQEGDRVVMPFNVACGTCLNCIRGYTSACLTMNPKQAGAAYGYADMGPYPGGQAELLRVPNADWACLRLPGNPGDSMEDDFVLLADIFPTSYHATEMAGVGPGKTVAIFGAGPVGLLAAYASLIKGANEVYVVDKSQTRLELVKSIGATPINFLEGDPVEQIKSMRKQNVVVKEGLHPEEKMYGVECGIDAVGYQAFDRQNPDEYNPAQVLFDLTNLINPTGRLGIIGAYPQKDPRAATEYEKRGLLLIPWGALWTKGVTIMTGQAPVKNYHAYLRDLIISGKAKPSFIVSDHIRIDQAPEAYMAFDKRDEVTKAIIKF